MRFQGIITEKVDVNGPNQHALFAFLKAGQFSGDVEWNFEKWLVDGTGAVVMRYEESIASNEENIREDIARTLQLGDAEEL